MATIFNGCPPSQATVEREFSTLNYIFGPLRSKLSNRILSDIMIIKLNSELLYDFFVQERKDLEKQYSNHNLLYEELHE